MGKIRFEDNRARNRGNRGPVSNSFFNNPVTRIVFLVISTLLFYNVAHSISITIQKLDILQRARLEVDDLRLKNLELALLLDSIQGAEYLEVQARDRLKLAGEGEYIFVIPEDVLEDAQSSLDHLLDEGKEEETQQVYEEWKDFLLRGV